MEILAPPFLAMFLLASSFLFTLRENKLGPGALFRHIRFVSYGSSLQKSFLL